MPKIKTIKFFTFGCKANQYDTQSMRERFLSRGFAESQSDNPDYCLVNTCTVTSGADQKSRNMIRRCIQSWPGAKVIATGCLAEKDWDELKKIKGIGLVVKKSFFPEGISRFSRHTRAFLKIQDGCANFCSYCKVALVRGKPRSKDMEAIMQEARSLVSCGHKEIVLTGICLGSYGKNTGTKNTLARVIKSLDKIEGLLRIRLSSIEAGDVTAGLIDCFKKSKKLCRHLHIPMQSGSDRILKLMNRKYSSAQFARLIARLKKQIPGIAITTDCLVGFPGETEDDFSHTAKLLEATLLLKAHIFPYSSRPQTKAASLPGAVDPKIIRRRCTDLAQVAAKCRDGYMKKFVGKQALVLIEEESGNRLFLKGFTDNYLPVLLPWKPGSNNAIMPVVLKSLDADTFLGQYLKSGRC